MILYKNRLYNTTELIYQKLDLNVNKVNVEKIGMKDIN